jgi:hypothetical protein
MEFYSWSRNFLLVRRNNERVGGKSTRAPEAGSPRHVPGSTTKAEKALEIVQKKMFNRVDLVALRSTSK